MKKFIFFFCMVTIISCKKEVKTTTKTTTPKEAIQKPSIFKISVEGFFAKNDYFLFFYENEEGKGFGKSNKLIKGFKGSPKKQTVTLTLPEDEDLYNFSLHISDKIGQEITIENLVITDGYDTIKIKKDSLFYNIAPNDYIEMRKDGSFDLLTKQKNGRTSYNPIFKCKKKLKNKLKFI